MRKKKSFKDFLYRHNVFSSPDLVIRDPAMLKGMNVLKDLKGKHMLYDDNKSRSEKIRSALRQRKLNKLLADPSMWKGLT